MFDRYLIKKYGQINNFLYHFLEKQAEIRKKPEYER